MTMTNLSRNAPRSSGRLADCRIVTVAMLSCLTGAFAVEVTSLRCEYRENPLGIDVEKPRMSWQFEAGKALPDVHQARGQRQTSYQILVASSEKLLAGNQGDLWDSGKVLSDESVHVQYAGKRLEAGQQCFWKVRIWDGSNAPSPWSASASWTMGVRGGWNGAWIAARDVPMNHPLGQTYIPGKHPPGNFIDGEGAAGGLGYHAVIATQADTVKWVQVNLGADVPIGKVRIRTLDHDGVKGFGFPLRFRLEVGEDAGLSNPKIIENRTASDIPNPGATVLEFDGHGLRGRYVRLTATKLFDRPNNPADFCFGLRTIEVISGGKNVALDTPVTAQDSVEDFGWGRKFLTANYVPTVGHRAEAVLMRRDVALKSKPVRAVAHVAGMGFVDFMINGRKAGDRVMAPALTDLTKRAYYDTYDVTDLVRSGTNTLGALVGNGYFACPARGWGKWYGVGNEPVASVDLELTMSDGSTQHLGTDGSWKWSTGEITFNDFFVGETQDLRLARPGWSQPGFDDRRWSPVAVVRGPQGQLEPNSCPAVRICKEVFPVKVEGNRYVFDAMYSGWPCVKLNGSAGRTVTLGGSAQYQFILKGGGEETLEPRFLVQSIGPVLTVEGIDPPPLKDVSIKWAHADLRQAGDFSCSSDFLNHVYAAEVRTHLSYTYDIPMDPTREKSGWTQDVQTMFDSAAYMTDMAAVYRRWWLDFRDSQTPDGATGSVAPMIWGGQEHCWDDPWWSGMIIYAPWKHYEYYGDKAFLQTAYPAMQSYLDWLSGRADADGILRWAGASDWIEVGIDGWGPPKRTPTYVVSTCAWYLYADILRQTARSLGKTDDVTRYSQLAQKIKDAFNAHCFNPDSGIYANATDSQTALILPLCLGMVPEGKQQLVLQRLEENIHAWKDHLSTGFVGTPYLLEGLPDFGLAELSYQIVNQRDYAGWNTLITDGVMKETWRGGMAQMPSLGGSVGQWFYRTLAGIRPGAPGFKQIIIKPSLVGDLTWVKAHHDCPYGRITSNWKRDGHVLTMEVAIPANTTATIHVPAKDAAGVTESGKPASKAEGVKFLRMENGAAVYEVGSGCYQFCSGK